MLELANGGTLFLDEVGELPPAVQVKLLRSLQERVILRVGDSQPRPVDFRLIAATLQDLEARIKEGVFREDLYYRLNVFSVQLSPLRHRKMDLPLIAGYLLARLAPAMGSAVRSLAPETLAILESCPWPGNVRELRNVLERALVMETGEVLSPDALPAKLQSATAGAVKPASRGEPAAGSEVAGGVALFAEAQLAFERAYFEALRAQVGDNVSAMARLAGLTRFTVYRKLRRIGWGELLEEDPGEAES